MSTICIREYQEEDLKKVHDLYKSRLIDRVHFSRDIEFIEHFIHFPVAKKCLYVAVSKEEHEHREEIVGFMIVAIIDKREYTQGVIAELCSVNETVTKSLVKKAISYCIKKRADIIGATCFTDKKGKAFSKSEGWFKANPYLMMGAVGSPLVVLQSLLKPKLKLLKRFVNGILFIIDDKMVHVSARNESLSVNLVEGKRIFADYSVRMDSHVFSAIVIGRSSPYFMYFRRKVLIKKLIFASSVFQNLIYKYKILNLLASLRIRKALHMTIIDAL